MTEPTPDSPAEPPADEGPPTVITRWATTADVPPAAWAAMSSDMRDVLAVTAAGGATVTHPDDPAGPPLFTPATIAFRVTTPDGPPLTVEVKRAAGSGRVETSATRTTGLVHLTMTRAAQHWGALVRTDSGADTRARAFADALGETLFGAADRAVGGGIPLPPVETARGITRAAYERAAADAPPGGDVVGYLNAAIAELTEERDGRALAAAALPPPDRR
ncbi:hypothetical protein [Geodermatophilus obscurus]|uniref:Uncharacterized protein n=1 Tax=Geodermatophilus obscurus (strain ATCC 25078 / DSM 43160 / JCM 3152 / CCUG 61914 / KCC A-0152 / KCTC 9177 / NBRC 13315 / NRRL B-3577 / G-20) TaxID=526225 RepID=D2SBQ5_GEOOG|nr:hypothetical protein [Geodermatophilus obscurus]ADB76162.1 hypothetical protein Gobs_3574 [Geodermatophilus obscurus DSM 43160]